MAKSADLPKETELVREIRARAAAEGISVATYLTREIQTPGRVWTTDEIFALAAALPVVNVDSASVIRELRGPLPDEDGDHR
ncbi:MAG TPA: hypothetical protein VGF48_08985 [Thermoanaerobaculia bacterium]|jgi:hypothetical protein